MKKLITYLLLVSCCFAGWKANAQDPHYTQAHRIPSWYNPAAAGHGVEHIRLTMLYRNQWSSVMSPFKTQGLFFDKQVSKVGLGANLVNNSSGDAGIRQLFLNGQLSYRYAFGKHVIASGLQIGLIQKSFDPSKMTFDDQYTPDQGANPATPTNETFSYTKLTRPDFGAGILWTYGMPGKEKFYPYVGLSMQHINQPKESFIEENNFIARKISVNGGVGIVLNETFTMTPMISFSQQQFAKELLGGVIMKMPLDGRDNVEGGLMFRNKDAVALYAGYQWNSFMLGMSYDVNISGLTGGPGAFELTLTYIPKAKEKKDPAKKKEKDKKPAQKPKVNSPAKKASIPTSDVTPPVPAKTPTPKVTEKTVPSNPGTTDEPKSNGTGKSTSPAPKTSGVTRPSIPTTIATPNSTVPSAKPTSIATPSAKVEKSIEKVDMKTVELKNSNEVPVAKIVLDPKKSTQKIKLDKSLPLESHDLPNLEAMRSKGLPAMVNIVLPKLQPKKGVVKTNSVAPLESREEESIESLTTKTTKTLPVVTPSTPEVKKSNTPQKLEIPTNAEEEPSSMSLMTPRKSLVHKVKVSKPEVKKVPVQRMNRLPIEKGDEVISTLPTLIPAPAIPPVPVATPAATSVTTPVVKDADKDGVSDDSDPCPYIKGSATTGGCPDTDGDGVIDMNDQCPMEAGDATLYGCPASKVLSDEGSAMTQHFGNIEFKTSSAVVHGIYKLDIIEPALDSVLIHADLMLVITGHTDNEGDAPTNMELSQARADAVRAIFLKKGMPEDKIQTVAYGETVPLKNNLTEEGRQHNRRVEVHVIRKKKP
jgi:type IX secretion system PorP/SprF family membrane protein